MPVQNASILDMRQVIVIRNLIAQKYEEDRIKEDFPNLLLREDALALLNRYCTVVYFPLEDEENNGFHIMGIPDKSGKERHFVFINTAQTIEKQVFTAAHELGHIWKVDQFVAKECGFELNQENSEYIINRFAAELLIPESLFNQLFDKECAKLRNSDGRITVLNMLKVIVALMVQFFVPQKSIIYRCWELGRFAESAKDLLLGNGDIPEDTINATVNEIIRDKGLVQFQDATGKKSIDGLAELLNRAEDQQCVSPEKIRHLREMFDLQPPVGNKQIYELLDEV